MLTGQRACTRCSSEPRRGPHETADWYYDYYTSLFLDSGWVSWKIKLPKSEQVFIAPMTRVRSYLVGSTFPMWFSLTLTGHDSSLRPHPFWRECRRWSRPHGWCLWPRLHPWRCWRGTRTCLLHPWSVGRPETHTRSTHAGFHHVSKPVREKRRKKKTFKRLAFAILSLIRAQNTKIWSLTRICTKH